MIHRVQVSQSPDSSLRSRHTLFGPGLSPRNLGPWHVNPGNGTGTSSLVRRRPRPPRTSDGYRTPGGPRGQGKAGRGTRLRAGPDGGSQRASCCAPAPSFENGISRESRRQHSLVNGDPRPEEGPAESNPVSSCISARGDYTRGASAKVEPVFNQTGNRTPLSSRSRSHLEDPLYPGRAAAIPVEPSRSRGVSDFDCWSRKETTI